MKDFTYIYIPVGQANLAIVQIDRTRSFYALTPGQRF
jgi:hypothetical protein